MFEKNISLFIENQFPDNFKNDGELLVKFMEYYYQWLEEEGNVTDVTRRLPEYSDPDKVPDEFFDFLRNEFMSGIPKNLKVDQKILLKNILDFYKSRGTERAYRLLFRILFNVEINFYYPGVDILRASDGKWYVGKRIDVRPIGDWGSDYAGITEIEGVVSGAKARVENVVPVIEGGVTLHKTYLYSIRGEFVKDEVIRARYSNEPIGTIASDGLVVEDGTWLNTDGHLSSNKYLQDNFYYQEFSYEIQSNIGLSAYRDTINNLLHPAGTKLFGKVISEYIIDMSVYSDIDMERWVSQSNDNFYVIDATDLGVSYDTTKRFDMVVDRTIQEFAGTGTIAINDGQILDFTGFSIGDFGRTPISLIGTRSLLVGTGTLFNTEIAQPNGPVGGQSVAIMNILDTGNAAHDRYVAGASFSNRFMSLGDNYFYPSMTGGTFSIIRSVYSEDYGYDQYVSIIGTGTVSWNNGTQLMTGTGTAFNMELSSEDIIEIVATGDRYLTTVVGDDVTASVFTGEGTLTASITNQPYRIYKNLTNPSVSLGNFLTYNALLLTDGPDYLVYS